MIAFDVRANKAQQKLLPPETLKAIGKAVSRHLRLTSKKTEVTIAFLSLAAMQQLNHDFRGKNKPTNVLSFPHYAPKDLAKALQTKPRTLYFGDVLLCLPYLRKEALNLKKPLNHHLIHLVVHGVLHLLGYDHIHNADAQKMERCETAILASLGIPCPYAELPHPRKRNATTKARAKIPR